MLTNKFTSIANFVAKLAYKHVMCNTYIPRVYIQLLSKGITAVKKCPLMESLLSPPPPRARGFRNQNS